MGLTAGTNFSYVHAWRFRGGAPVALPAPALLARPCSVFLRLWARPATSPAAGGNDASSSGHLILQRQQFPQLLSQFDRRRLVALAALMELDASPNQALLPLCSLPERVTTRPCHCLLGRKGWAQLGRRETESRRGCKGLPTPLYSRFTLTVSCLIAGAEDRCGTPSVMN